MQEIYSKFIGNGKFYKEFACTSGETKPTENLVTGSKVHEVDTATLYALDANTGTWYPQIEMGGGSTNDVPR